MNVPIPGLHLESHAPGDSMCGLSSVRTTIVVDACGCDDCMLLEGFRSADPVKRADEDRRAAKLLRKIRDAVAQPVADQS